jgi:hypothetical protein
MDDMPNRTGEIRPLDANERRVLGVLIEKAKTTPDQYPLSLNALLTGCNQKSMPMFVGFEWLDEARPLLGWCPLVAVEESGALEHPEDARWTDSDDILIEHHERESPITFEWEPDPLPKS